MEAQIFAYNNVDQIVKGMYGSEIDIDRACGFCKKHRKYLTVKMLKQHECLCKQCYHLIRNENHAWWKQREIQKNKRMERKRKQNDYYLSLASEGNINLSQVATTDAEAASSTVAAL